jgi:hypothetical protein
MKIIIAIRNSREDKMSFSENGYQLTAEVNYNLIDYSEIVWHRNHITG